MDNSDNKIRNFCIIAHIDHGKSTLADRLLEITGTVSKREMREQILDQMDLEQERGITIKLTPARMEWRGYELNLIDTPGHVDFNYEVSRSLAAVEGALLLVDATQGVQAQTIGNLYLALEQNLTIIPVVNKIDLPAARVEEVSQEIIGLMGCKKEDIYLASGKTGEGVTEILEAIIKKVPSPTVRVGAPLRALIFDSKYDDYRGVVAYVRIIDGQVKKGDKIFMIGAESESEVLEVGFFNPKMQEKKDLLAGEIGYVVTGLKNIAKCRVGDTITLAGSGARPLTGYKAVKPMVFAGIFAKEGHEYNDLREALLKLKLNDAALTFEPERSVALGFGFRVGLLGLLHLEIVQERLRREYGLDLIVTVPSVAYKIYRNNNEETIIKSPQDLPDPNLIKKIEEPWVATDIVTPEGYIGNVMQLVQEKRGVYKNTEYLFSKGNVEKRAILHYDLPLSAILVDFYDNLKSVTSGYASLNYEFLDYREAEVERLDILVAQEPVEALSSIVYKDAAQYVGRRVVESLKKTLPRQMFEVKIQAAIGSKIIASEKIPAMRKDVLAKMSGGDATRKSKLLEKQKKGKKKMAKLGKVDIPPEAFLAVLKK
ncbi:MAG: translation elongation factor 4 [Patescibacteria group bacterium]|nr:translation elongation factor 4 [Patescibacteria group bacterium]MDD5490607.1 translation elongation factor 4 [Patescibacteria group bacterium]